MIKKTNRINEITSFLRLRGNATLQELADSFEVSTATIRRDIKNLELSGQVVQTLGGGVILREDFTTPLSSCGFYPAIDEVIRIAEHCTTMIADKDTILLGPGLTPFMAGKIIGGLDINIRVMTNSLSLAQELSRVKNIHTFILGGEIQNDYTLSEDSYSFNKIQFANKLFFTVDGIDLDYGLSLFSNVMVPMIKKMMSISREIVLIADSSKFGKVCFNVIEGFERLSRIITDKKISPALVRGIEDRGIPVTLV
ncbi:MAG: DeoR/GlpR family DNA-binding transcription regulator [Spirochaetales bacterium]|jgi:DeoR/GlpR family transcriptional regulator of sugar metabolism|nr:DeoR/GlpR family DNA-binding transcription regulator [Spirochaetales bacterium]